MVLKFEKFKKALFLYLKTDRSENIDDMETLLKDEGVFLSEVAILLSTLMKELKWRSLLLWGSAILGYYVWFQSFYNAVACKSLFPYSGLSEFAVGVLRNLPPTLMVCLLNLAIIFRLVRISNLKVKICMDLLLSIAAVMAVDLLYLGVTRRPVIDFAGTVLADIVFFCIVEMVYYFRHISLLRAEKEKAELRALQYKYDALKASVNPHFLFNSLNLLNSLVDEDTELSKKFIFELSSMYRYVLTHYNRESVSVADELKFLASYVSVLEMRYANKFTVTVRGSAIPGSHIIPFTLQMLVENATKHNAITSKTPMRIEIFLSDSGITVTNPVYPKKNSSGTHTGLSYLYRLYAAHQRVFNVEKIGQRFTASVPYL